jgi:hypothetical protein
MSMPEPDRECAECVDAAPYVLGALEDAEDYREHLLRCVICRAEVAELQLVADTLPATVTPAPAPETLRERVLATVRSEAELLRAAGQQADEPPRRASQGSGSTSVPSTVHGVRELLVTSEPLGGSAHPTGAPVIRVVLNA